MKKIIKKSISALIAVIICVSAFVPTFAEGTEINRDCPKVYVHGFMSYELYADADDPDSELAWPLPEDKILDTVKKALIPLAACAIDRDLDKFGNAIAPLLDELFAPACLDFNGEATNGSGVQFEYPAPEEVTADSNFTFGYDWRLDPIELASRLNDFIDYILECSGTEQVVLECHSLGGIVITTYFKLYGNEKVRSVVFNSPAIYGETYTGELITGNIDFNAEGVKNFIGFTFDHEEYENTINLISEILEKAGLLDFVCDFADELLAQIYDEAIISVIKFFANWPTIWAMVPDEDIEAAKETVFGMYDEYGFDYSGLEEKIDSYNEKVRQYKTQILTDTAKTTNVYVISKYGYSAVPITSSWNTLGDGVVDTKRSSFGATTAPYGEKLEVAQSEYISPDKAVDASTCLFPEQTWFIRDMKHPDDVDCLTNFMDTLLYYDGLATVETFEQYPRFMVFDFDNDALLADKGAQPLSFLELIKLAVLEIINAIKSLFAGIAQG